MTLFGVLFLASVIAIAVYLTPGEEKPGVRDAGYGWAEDKTAPPPGSLAARLCAALARTAPSA